MKKFILILAIILVGIFAVRNYSQAAVTNCECGTGPTNMGVFNSPTVDHTSYASSESQCNYDCGRSVVPPAGKVVYYKHNGSNWKRVTATCNQLYGGDFSCVTNSSIKDTSQCKGACPNDTGGQCCPSSVVQLGQCPTNYMCQDTSFLTPTQETQCKPISCSSQTVANGKCCPNTAAPDPIQPFDRSIPGSTESGGIVQCGRGGQNMCTLCDLIAGLNWVIKYIMRIAVGVALAAFAVAAVMYVVSTGDTGMTGKAKGLMVNAAKGFVIIFAAWLIVNFSIMGLGAKSNLGINVTSWGEFECTAKAR